MNIKLQKMALACFAVLLFTTIHVKGQFSFTNSNNKLSTTSRSGNCVTVVDVNSDGLDDILKMENSKTLVLELQNRDGS